LLRPGGVLFFTNIATGNPYRIWMTYLASWHLNERSELDLARSVESAAVPASALSVERDTTGLTLLAQLTKPLY
jgi:hypothetical protein